MAGEIFLANASFSPTPVPGAARNVYTLEEVRPNSLCAKKSKERSARGWEWGCFRGWSLLCHHGSEFRRVEPAISTLGHDLGAPYEPTPPSESHHLRMCPFTLSSPSWFPIWQNKASGDQYTSVGRHKTQAHHSIAAHPCVGRTSTLC